MPHSIPNTDHSNKDTYQRILTACERSRAPRRKAGYFCSRKLRDKITWSMRHQLSLIEMAELDARVVGFRANPPPVSIVELAGEPAYRPSIEYLLRDGRTLLLDVAQVMGIEQRDEHRFRRLVETAANRAGKDYCILSPSVLRGHTKRNTDAIRARSLFESASGTADAIRDHLRIAREGSTIGDLIRLSRDDNDCLAALNEMAATREIEFDLRPARLEDCLVRLFADRGPL